LPTEVTALGGTFQLSATLPGWKPDKSYGGCSRREQEPKADAEKTQYTEYAEECSGGHKQVAS
jgi:hypothetical protein